MFRTGIRIGFAVVSLLGVLFAPVSPATAQLADDLLGLHEDGSSSVTFGAPGLPPIPADFFGPGSDPFEGQIALMQTDLLDPDTVNGSVLMRWGSPPMAPQDPVGSIVHVPVTLADMRVASPAYMPLNISYFGNTAWESWFMEVRLSTIPAPVGEQVTTKTHVNGGAFESVIMVQPLFIFRRQSDGLVVELDTALFGYAPLPLSIGGAPWVHAPDPSLGCVGLSSPFMVSGVEEAIPGDESSQCRAVFTAEAPGSALVLELVPSRWLPQPDPYVSIPGDEPQGTVLIFQTGGDNPPIPADFFGPGSDPFEGQVALRGEPLGPTPWGDFEDADTLILRAKDPFDRCEPPSPDYEVVNLGILALNLVSIDPITVTYNGGLSPEAWNLRMTPVPGGTNLGYVTATKLHGNGGVFQGDYVFSPRYELTRVGDGVSLTYDGPMPLDFVTPDGVWVHTVDPALDVLTPSSGRFVPGVHQAVPEDPGSQEVVPHLPLEVTGVGNLAFLPVDAGLSAVELPTAGAGGLRVAPNPFNPSTHIRFDLARQARVSLCIFDVQGRLVRTLVSEVMPAGPHESKWSARDDRGRKVSSGVYLGVLRTGEEVRTAKLIVLK